MQLHPQIVVTVSQPSQVIWILRKASDVLLADFVDRPVFRHGLLALTQFVKNDSQIRTAVGQIDFVVDFAWITGDKRFIQFDCRPVFRYGGFTLAEFGEVEAKIVAGVGQSRLVLGHIGKVIDDFAIQVAGYQKLRPRLLMSAKFTP